MASKPVYRRVLLATAAAVWLSCAGQGAHKNTCERAIRHLDKCAVANDIDGTQCDDIESCQADCILSATCAELQAADYNGPPATCIRACTPTVPNPCESANDKLLECGVTNYSFPEDTPCTGASGCQAQCALDASCEELNTAPFYDCALACEG